MDQERTLTYSHAPKRIGKERPVSWDWFNQDIKWFSTGREIPPRNPRLDQHRSDPPQSVCVHICVGTLLFIIHAYLWRLETDIQNHAAYASALFFETGLFNQTRLISFLASLLQEFLVFTFRSCNYRWVAMPTLQ